MSLLRTLTEYEIKSILSFLKPQQGIPLDTALSVVNIIRKNLKKQLRNVQIYPEMIPILKNKIEWQFQSSKIQAGESVGVIGAQSIGEKQTQTTLNTFHKAGSGEKTVTTGVPRVEELLNATKDPKSVNCIAYMKDTHNSIAALRETIGHNVVEITFANITKSYEIVMNKEPEQWYEAFKIIHGDTFTNFTDCISLKVDMDILYEYKLEMKDISDIVSHEYSDMVCVFSPDNIGQLDIFIDTSSIELPENRLVFVDSENAHSIYLEEVVQPILYNIIICGVPGIKNIYFNDDPNSFETDGSNYKKILGLPFIDNTKTISNNVWDIYSTLGVEAARQFLIEEFMGLCSGINKCHIQLLAEKMTHSGSISSISRYTMRNEECGPMGKASFEETMDNFLKAGAYGQKEETSGVSASIICGKRANIGTGVSQLMIDVKALPKNIRVLHNIKEKMTISEYNSVISLSTRKNKIDKEYEAPKQVPERYEKSDNTVVRLREDFFELYKFKATVYFGSAELNIDDAIDENGNDNSNESVLFSFDSNKPQEITLRWKNGIKAGKEVFAGYDTDHGVYMPLDGVPLIEQGRFMRIVGKPVKIDSKTVIKNKKTKKSVHNSTVQQMTYLEF